MPCVSARPQAAARASSLVMLAGASAEVGVRVAEHVEPDLVAGGAWDRGVTARRGDCARLAGRGGAEISREINLDRQAVAVARDVDVFHWALRVGGRRLAGLGTGPCIRGAVGCASPLRWLGA